MRVRLATLVLIGCWAALPAVRLVCATACAARASQPAAACHHGMGAGQAPDRSTIASDQSCADLVSFALTATAETQSVVSTGALTGVVTAGFANDLQRGVAAVSSRAGASPPGFSHPLTALRI